MIETSKDSPGLPNATMAGAHPLDVAVVVGPSTSISRSKPALELVAVVGDVGREVGRRPVRPDQDASLSSPSSDVRSQTAPSCS
jgi:hypothetical protein